MKSIISNFVVSDPETVEKRKELRARLAPDRWNDFDYVTIFTMYY